MADEPLDPRYDAQYQRGYIQGTAAPARRAAADRTETPKPYIAPLRGSRPGGDAERAAAARPVDTVVAPASTGPAPAHDPRAELRARAEAAAADAVPPSPAAAPIRRDIRRNPYLWAVLAVGVLLIIAGAGMYTHLGQALNNENNGTASSILQLQFELGAAPLALAAGVVAILGVGLVHALDWQRRG